MSRGGERSARVHTEGIGRWSSNVSSVSMCVRTMEGIVDGGVGGMKTGLVQGMVTGAVGSAVRDTVDSKVGGIVEGLMCVGMVS